MKDLGYGSGYQYAHDAPDARVEQEHLPESLRGRQYYRPDRPRSRGRAGPPSGRLAALAGGAQTSPRHWRSLALPLPDSYWEVVHEARSLVAVLALAILGLSTGTTLAAPGEPRVVQGTLEWPAAVSTQPFVVIRGDDGRMYYADINSAQRRTAGQLAAGTRVSAARNRRQPALRDRRDRHRRR